MRSRAQCRLTAVGRVARSTASAWARAASEASAAEPGHAEGGGGADQGRRAPACRGWRRRRRRGCREADEVFSPGQAGLVEDHDPTPSRARVGQGRTRWVSWGGMGEGVIGGSKRAGWILAGGAASARIGPPFRVDPARVIVMPPRFPPHRSRLPAVGTTIFTVMSRLAQECGAINLSQGFPISAPGTCCSSAFPLDARRPEPVRADGRRAGAARGHRRQGGGRSTARATTRNEITVTAGATRRCSPRWRRWCIRATR